MTENCSPKQKSKVQGMLEGIDWNGTISSEQDLANGNMFYLGLRINPTNKALAVSRYFNITDASSAASSSTTSFSSSMPTSSIAGSAHSVKADPAPSGFVFENPPPDSDPTDGDWSKNPVYNLKENQTFKWKGALGSDGYPYPVTLMLSQFDGRPDDNYTLCGKLLVHTSGFRIEVWD